MSALDTAASAWSETFPVVDAFRERIIATGVGPAQMTLLAFLLTFLIVRTITHLIKAGRGPFGNLSVGGTHLHHLVPGIFLLLISGFVAIAVDPGATGVVWLLPTMFGIGAALTLDEFALWLTLSDVYWEREGRRSVDAVIVAGALLGIVAMGIPFWVDIFMNANPVGSWSIIIFHVLCVGLATLTFLKGKWIFGFLSLIVFPIGLIGACRLARPTSPWARRFYGVRKTVRSQARYPEDRRLPMWPWQKPAPAGDEPGGSDTESP